MNNNPKFFELKGRISKFTAQKPESRNQIKLACNCANLCDSNDSIQQVDVLVEGEIVLRGGWWIFLRLVMGLWQLR